MTKQEEIDRLRRVSNKLAMLVGLACRPGSTKEQRERIGDAAQTMLLCEDDRIVSFEFTKRPWEREK